MEQIPSPSQSIAIGNRVIPSRVFLAPLAGYTHLAFRNALREIGGLGLATTDLVLASQLVAQSKKSVELVKTNEADKPLTVQIFSGVTKELVSAAHWLEEHDYEAIDINMGCPMAKVTGNGGGARLMCDVEGARNTVEKIVQAVSLPVSVKMRLGWDSDHITAPQLAKQFEEVGAIAITIHGRTRQQGFHGGVDREGIKAVVDAVDSIPVVANGDVRTVEDAIQMRDETGCAAIAIGRGALLDPWIFRKIMQADRGETPTEPTPEEQIAFLQRHFQLMVEQYEEYSCIMLRKFAGWYGARLGIPEALEDRLRQFNSYAEFDQIVEEIKEKHGQRISPLSTTLLRVPRGPIDKW